MEIPTHDGGECDERLLQCINNNAPRKKDYTDWPAGCRSLAWLGAPERLPAVYMQSCTHFSTTR